MKAGRIVATVVFSVVMVFLCIVLGLELFRKNHAGNANFTWQYASYEMILEKEFPASDITELSIFYGMNSNDIYIFEHSEATVIVREYLSFVPQESEISTVTLKNHSLEIRGGRRNSHSGWFFSSGYRGGYTEIWLPEGWMGSLTAETLSGDVIVDQTVFAGDVLEITTVSGDIKIPFLSGRCDISTVSGDVRLGSVTGSFTISSTSGDIDISSGSCSGWAETVSGDVKMNFAELTGDLDVVTTSGDVVLSLSGEDSFDFRYESTSGSCRTFFDDKLSFNRRETEAWGNYGETVDKKIQISTVSGDLRIMERK